MDNQSCPAPVFYSDDRLFVAANPFHNHEPTEITHLMALTSHQQKTSFVSSSELYTCCGVVPIPINAHTAVHHSAGCTPITGQLEDSIVDVD
jgi:hypothetical protein